MLDDTVATQDTVTQLIAAIGWVSREVPGAAAVIAEQCRAHDYSDRGQSATAWDDQAGWEALVSGLVNDVTAVLDALAAADLDDKAGQAMALPAVIAGQDVVPAEGGDGTDGRWRSAARKVTVDRVTSMVDPEPRHTARTGTRPMWRSSPAPAWSPAVG